jgi:hypothetical protein
MSPGDLSERREMAIFGEVDDDVTPTGASARRNA